MNYAKVKRWSISSGISISLALILFICSSLLLGSITAATLAIPPPQPASGPGGADYTYGAVKSSTYVSGAAQYWIYEPASPTPVSAPVIVFNHGWSAEYPQYYGAWINHLVKKGNIVIYPRYQMAHLLHGPV